MKKFLKEFKDFITVGNVMDMTVGVIIGGAFGKIVTSLVNDILMPIIGILIGGLDFSSLKISVGNSVISYGNFILNIVDFLIIALSIFFFVKTIQHMKAKILKIDEDAEKSEEVDENIQLLREIRDILKKSA